MSEHSATQIKQAVVGTGGAGKEQVQHMVMHLLKLSATPVADAADAPRGGALPLPYPPEPDPDGGPGQRFGARTLSLSPVLRLGGVREG